MRITELTADFGGFSVDIRGLELKGGLVHGFIGPNGSGKTTIAKLIAGVVPARRREIDFGGIAERDVTMTFQKPYMLRGTVYENLVYPLKLRGMRPDEREVSRYLELCGLSGCRNMPARRLSAGQQHKLSLARALIFRPRLVIVDESLSNLDPDGVEAFEEEILRIQREDPITWIVISHQLAHVRRLCDMLHFVDAGRIVISGPPGEILRSPGHPALVRYLRRETVAGGIA